VIVGFTTAYVFRVYHH